MVVPYQVLGTVEAKLDQDLGHINNTIGLGTL
jgi:hypothetical protein